MSCSENRLAKGLEVVYSQQSLLSESQWEEFYKRFEITQVVHTGSSVSQIIVNDVQKTHQVHH